MSGIFHQYDLRGVVPSEVNERIVHDVGVAFVNFLHCKEKDVVIGRDGRESSPILQKALMNSIIQHGANVIDIGICTTPEFYFAVANYGRQGGIMVTASHNPKEYNGLKLVRERAMPIALDSGLNVIEEFVRVSERMKETQQIAKKGRITKQQVISDYANHILQFSKSIRSLRVVVDAGGGTTAFVLPHVLKKLPLQQSIPLYFELDSALSVRNPNPLVPGALTKLHATVLENNCDLGVAFDADGDRVVFVDDKGALVRPDIAGALIARGELKNSSDATTLNNTIIVDTRTGRAVVEDIIKHGGKVIVSPVGRTSVQRLMKEHNAIFGMERSGHYFFRDNFFMDSGIIGMLKMLSIVSEKHQLSSLCSEFGSYVGTNELNFIVEDRSSAIERVKNAYSDARLSTLDGITIEYKDWWCNVRASNTEPVLRVTIEAKTQEELDKRIKELTEIIKPSH